MTLWFVLNMVLLLIFRLCIVVLKSLTPCLISFFMLRLVLCLLWGQFLMQR